MASRSTVIPSFSATRRDATFLSLTIDTIRTSRSVSKAQSLHAAAASVAITLALVAPAHNPAQFDLRPPLHESADQTTIADELTGSAKDDGAPPEPVLLIPLEIALDPRA